MPVCKGCGGSYDKEFKFCPNCGRAKPESESLKVEVNVTSSDRWETCKIDFVIVEKGTKKFLSAVTHCRGKWVATALGKNGKYIASESPVFDGYTAFLAAGYVLNAPYNLGYLTKETREDKERTKMVKQLLEDFIDNLLKDGWDYVGNYENNFEYQKQFRRHAR